MSTETNDTKTKVQDALRAGVEAGKTAAEATKGKTWPAWLRWFVIIGGAVAAAVGAWTQTSCTQSQVREVGHVVHAIYHYDTGTDCIFEQTQEGK